MADAARKDDTTPITDPTTQAQNVAIQVRLTGANGSDQPVAANYSAVAVAQGIAYLDFGFIEPGLIGAVIQGARQGKKPPQAIPGKQLARLAMPLESAVRLQQQLTQIVKGLQQTRSARSGK